MIDKKERISLRRQCALLNIAKSTIYYKQRPIITEEELCIVNKIDEIYTTHPYFGTRRMSKELIDYGIDVGRDFIRKAYNILGIGAIYPKINLSKRNHQHKIYPYLLRNLLINYVNHVWSTDITYIRLKHGFAYLVAVIDWFSRKVLSWRISNTMEVGFCVEALNEALENYPAPEIFNTDQGSQFTSIEFTSILLKNNIRISMDGRGRALDNVFIERFWRSLKQEKIYLLELSSVNEAKIAINEYMDFYNRRRKHQSLDYITPDEVYYKNLELKAS
jgi:putative transposase